MQREGSRRNGREGTREALLKAAHTALGGIGFEVGAEELARAAGVARGAVRAHFGSRDGLLAAAAEAGLATIAEDAERRLGRACGLRGVVGAHLQALARHEAFYVHIIERRSRLTPAVLQRLDRIEAAVADRMQLALASGGAGCSARVGSHFAFQVWMALVHHRLLGAGRPSGGVFALARRREALVRNYLALVRGEVRPRRGRAGPDGRTGPVRSPPSPSPAGMAW